LDTQWYAYCFAKSVKEVNIPDNRGSLWSRKYTLGFESDNISEALEFGRGDPPWILERTAVGNGSKLLFEGDWFSVFSNYNEYLARRYAGYEKKTKEQLESAHPVKAYRI
jgi:hypothetical protein